MSNHKLLVKKRGYLRTQVTKIQTTITNTIDVMSVIDQRTCLLQLEQMDIDIRKYDEDIIDLAFELDDEFDVGAELKI